MRVSGAQYNAGWWRFRGRLFAIRAKKALV